MSLITELKRRNVFKVAAAYLVVGWVIVEVAATVAPQLALPEWAPRLITFMVMLGFPLALVLAWIFDMTPEGIQVTEGGPGNRRFYTIVGVIAAAALGWIIIDHGGNTGIVQDAQAQPSIAVLAFDNMSPDAENAFFAEGISEEILNILAGIEGLKVASRTSAFSFKGKDTSIPEIARLLDVGHVLEGSVRKQGDRVRITAQLIHAKSDAHLWSESYDRELTDIFKVQEEIAQAITVALRDVLGARRVQVSAPTDDLEAYERFLRGRTNFYQRLNLDRAISDLEFATERDQDFADAWAFLAAARYVTATGGYPTTHDRAALGERIDEPTARALALRPESSLALAVRGVRLIDRQSPDAIAEGLELLRMAAARETHDTTARMWLGLQLLVLGRFEEALPAMEEAYRTDPLVAINTGYLGYAYFVTGREQEGLELARRASAMSRWGTGAYLLSLEMANRGRLEEAAELYAAGTLEMGIPSEDNARLNASFARAIADSSHRPAHRALREEIEAELGFPVVGDSVAYGPEGLADARWPTSTERGAGLFVTLAAWLPSAEWMRESPEYFRFAERWGFTGYWAKYGYPLDCRRADGPGEPRLECGD